jgi:hypothetical protein
MPVRSISFGASGNDKLADLFLDGLDLLIDALQLDDQLDRETASGFADQVAWLDGRDQCAGLLGGQELLRPRLGKAQGAADAAG